ncbi:RNA polymerase, sigma 54 subunit, RpoN/SigL [Marinococcus luteus]|uniref:RNA polymerase, sigma 54 subunit, RpoN/SigL n=2 Tax=Marinococcus luteus TaxID=1122204 RepID=A0A1H2XIK9_9BACI|nr:RNA polymerase, sigma 54 subunit, RpoN/SigL [Marinococcus luteus]
MGLGLELQQKQEMSLVMTQELKQAIALLKLSSQELSDYLQEEAMENPLMDLTLPSITDGASLSASRAAAPVYNPASAVEQPDWREPAGETLEESLREQIACGRYKGNTRDILLFLAGSVDERGYLEDIEQEMDQKFQLGKEESGQYISMLQQLEPAGVGARNLKECLLLQLERCLDTDPYIDQVVAEDLEALGAKKWRYLQQKYQLTKEQLQEIYTCLQKLSPHPGDAYQQEKTISVSPDVQVEEIDGEWVVTILNDRLPELQMNEKYWRLLQQDTDEEARQYAMEKYKQFLWIVKSVEQRQQTLQKVSEVIVKAQSEYLKHGEEKLRPLTLREVAEQADMHESTVSRTTSRKYMQTPHGLVELKHFFSSKITRPDEDASSTGVKAMMKKLIKEENKEKPLSDQKLADLLQQEQQCTISRRAVAKYRTELRIPSSSQRKQPL